MANLVKMRRRKGAVAKPATNEDKTSEISGIRRQRENPGKAGMRWNTVTSAIVAANDI